VTSLDAFVRFQQDQRGILCATDAAMISRVSKVTVLAWASSHRVKTIERYGRVYFGLASLCDWNHYRLQFARENSSTGNLHPNS